MDCLHHFGDTEAWEAYRIRERKYNYFIVFVGVVLIEQGGCVISYSLSVVLSVELLELLLYSMTRDLLPTA